MEFKFVSRWCWRLSGISALVFLIGIATIFLSEKESTTWVPESTVQNFSNKYNAECRLNRRAENILRYGIDSDLPLSIQVPDPQGVIPIPRDVPDYISEQYTATMVKSKRIEYGPLYLPGMCATFIGFALMFLFLWLGNRLRKR
jgi:hypothetical protein